MRQQEHGKTNVTQNVSDLRERFQEVKEKEVETSRVVKLKYKSCCGCGCTDVTVERTVPFDSPLNNGDRITELGPTDKMV